MGSFTSRKCLSFVIKLRWKFVDLSFRGIKNASRSVPLFCIYQRGMLFRALFTSLWKQKYFRSSFLCFRKDYLLNTDSLLQIKLKKKKTFRKKGSLFWKKSTDLLAHLEAVRSLSSKNSILVRSSISLMLASKIRISNFIPDKVGQFFKRRATHCAELKL